MMTIQRRHLFILISVLSAILTWPASAEDRLNIDEEGTVFYDNNPLPVSGFLSPQGQEAMRSYVRNSVSEGMGDGDYYYTCKIVDKSGTVTRDPAAILKARECFVKKNQYPKRVSNLKAIHPVNIETKKINGIEVDAVSPKQGISKRNKHRVLFYIHGSGAFVDHPDMRKLGSVPAASVGNIKVMGVDHRLMPEGGLAESQADLAAAYRGLLKEYPAENIGMFGCSQGGYLTATMMPYLKQQGLPLPGAIAIQGEAGNTITAGDAPYFISAFAQNPMKVLRPGDYRKIHSKMLYWEKSDLYNDPSVYPMHYDSAMQIFPPTIFMNSTRDGSMSRAIHDHRALLRNGVDAELHIWEGLPHCFTSRFPDIPETKDYWKQMISFFDKHLGVEPIRRD